MWQRSHQLVLDVHRATASSFPQSELDGLTSQVKRSAVSVPTNIVEGRHRRGERKPGHFLRIALSSAAELDYLLLLGRDLRMLKPTDHTRLSCQVEEVKKMLAAFIVRLEAKLQA